MVLTDEFVHKSALIWFVLKPGLS